MLVATSAETASSAISPKHALELQCNWAELNRV